MNDALVRSQDLSLQVHKFSRQAVPAAEAADHRRIVSVRHKADILAVMLPGRHQSVLLRNAPCFRLGQFPQRKQRVRQLVLIHEE